MLCALDLTRRGWTCFASERRAQSAERRAQSAERRAQSAERRGAACEAGRPGFPGRRVRSLPVPGTSGSLNSTPPGRRFGAAVRGAWRGLLPTLLCLALHAALAPGAAAQAPTPNMDGSYTVPYHWALKPAGLAEDDRFRLFIVTTSTTQALSSDIATYNSLVQTDVAAGHTAIRPYAPQFRVVGSTLAVDARDNTMTTGQGTGILIYWLNGSRVAGNYDDFYDGWWDSRAGRRPPGDLFVAGSVWTGSEPDGTVDAGYELGPPNPNPVRRLVDARYGSLFSLRTGLSYYRGSSTNRYPLYGMSPVFVVAPPPPPPELTITGGAAVTEGGTASYTITADAAPPVDLTVKLSVADAGSPSDFVAAADEGAATVTLDAGDTTATFTVATVNDTGGDGDEPSGEVTVTLEAGTGYTLGTASSASVAVSDNDATTVTLEGVAVNLPEGSKLEFSVRLSRALVAGETLPVPVTFSGEASLADFTVSCPAPLPTGVTCAGLGTASATVTFTGPSARIVDLEVLAVQDATAEADPESVEIGLGTLGATSGTGLDGGATGVDNLADFNIADAIGVALAFSVESSSVNEGAMNAVAQYTANVFSGTVPKGGVVIPFTVNTGTAEASDASTADYGTVPAGITIAAGGFSGTADVPIVDDLEDELTEQIRFLVGELPPGYTFHGGTFDASSSEVTIVDDDETEISLTGGGTITEQDTTTTATLTVSAERRLFEDPWKSPAAESLTVPLALTTTTGAALPGSTSPLFAVTASGTGVALSGANSATPTLTFTGSNTDVVQTATVTITATANGDADTTPETVTVTLGNMTATMDGGVIPTMANSATLTIADDDDPLPELSVAVVGDASVTEGGSATIRVTRAGGGTSAALSFSATATDADGFSGTFSAVTSIPAGQRSVDITYSVAQDDNDAPRDEATYALDADSAYTVSSTAGSVSLEVVDDDPTELTVTGIRSGIKEGEFRSAQFTLFVNQSGTRARGLVSGESLTVPVTFGGTATRGTDYTLRASTQASVTWNNLDDSSETVTLTFTGPDSGVSRPSATLQIFAVADDVVEDPAETVDLGLGTPVPTGLDGGAIVEDSAPPFTIREPVTNPVNLLVSANGLTEGGSALTITATLDSANASGAAISIPLQVDAVHTEAQASDYTVASSISIADGARSGTTSFTVTDDQVAEDDELVVLEVGSALPEDIDRGEDSLVAIVIEDNDAPGLVFSPTSLGVTEGDDASYTVKLATLPTGTVTVAITGHSGTDLTLDATSLTFTTSTWDDVQTVTVTAGEDTDTTNDTAALTHAASGGGYDAVSADLAVTVTDNDTPGLVLSPASLEVDEGDDASYTVRLATLPTGTVTVAISGHSGTDLTLDATSLTFTTSTWDDVQTVTVTAGQDPDITDDTATLTHAASGGGYSVSADLAVTVTDDDTRPEVSFELPSSSAREDDGTHNVTVNLSPSPTAAITVSYTVGGTATGSDFSISGSGTLSVASGATTATIPVVITDDAADESSETVLLTLTAGSGYTVGSVDSHTLTIMDDDGTQLPTVSLSVAPNPVTEGSAVTVTARLSEALSSSVTVPLTLTAGTAEADDYGPLASIIIAGGQTMGTGTVTTAQDADEDNETFTVALDLDRLPSGVTAGSPPSVQVTIREDDGGEPPEPEPPVNSPPSVSLSASPNPVTEGGSVTVTARLSEALSGSVTIPLTLTAGTAEPEDFGSLASITISSGQTTGTGTVTTAQDADEDDETFTVALGSLPSEVTAGSPSSVQVTIREDDGGEPPEPEPPVNSPPTVRVSCDPCSVAPGGEARLTATASDPDGDRLTYRWSATAGRFDGPTDRSVARWTAPAETGRVTFTVRVSDGEDSVSATVTVEVVNRAPAFEASVYRFELAENLDGSRQSVHLGQVAASDPDGDELTYDVLGGDREHFRVGSRDGVVKYVGSGEDFEAEPNRYELTVQAQDPHGAAAETQVVVTVTNVNERPEAEDDAAETPEDEAVTVDVLANDTDPDGDSLRVESVSAPEHGTTRIASGGGVLYTPAANYHGADRFTYVVTDPEGETASAAVEVTVLSVNDAPVAVGAIPDQPLDEGGGSVDVELTPYFEDIDGDELAYRAASSDTDVATVRVAGAVLTVTPVVYGSAMVTVTAEDPEGLTATQTFTVGVDDRLVRAVLGNTLAAMARSHLASARMTLGRRVEAGGSEESRVTVMGRAVPLGKAAARQAAEQMVMGLLSSGACSGSSAHGLGGTSFGTAGAAPGLGAYPASGCGGPATGGPSLGASAFGGPGLGGPMSVGMPPGSTGGLYGFGGFGGGPDALLHGTEFELALGGDEDGGGGWMGRRLSVWGQGDIQTFHGAPTVYRYDARYDGDMRTGYVGVDARLTERWLAGVAVSRSGGRSDWQVGASRGHLKTKLTALHPYAQWSDGTTSVWTMAGGGWGDGEAENVREATGLLGTSTLGLRLGLVELRRELGATGGGTEFGLRADAAWAELRTGEGRETVDGLAAAVNQQRVGAEVARPLRLGPLGLQPFGAAHLRRDGGAGQTGTGVEVAFGLGLTGGIVRLDVQARTLAVHSASGYGERGAGLTLTVGGQKREGLSLSVSPTWGDAASGTGALWQEEVYRHYLPEKEQDAFAVDARGDYGMRLPNGGLLSWFGSYSHSPYGRGFLVGGSIGGLADALLPGR